MPLTRARDKLRRAFVSVMPLRLLVATAITIALPSHECISAPRDTGVRFGVTLTVYTHGTHRLETYRLGNERFIAIRHPRSGSPDVIVADRSLTRDERTRLERFFRGFPLASLSDKYVNPRIEGEVHRVFEISINGKSRTISVYFMEQKDLDALSAEISRLLSGR